MHRWTNAKLGLDLARKNTEPIQCPVLILVGTADGLIYIDPQLHDLLEKAGKAVRMEVYENGYHDFRIGPQGHAGRAGEVRGVSQEGAPQAAMTNQLSAQMAAFTFDKHFRTAGFEIL